MNELLTKLFNLHSLSAGAEGVEWRFARPLPAWVWIGVIVACMVFALWSYWRLLGNRTARIALGAMRGLALLIIAVLIAGPELVKQNERVEKDWVVVMADRSSSMTVTDVPAAPKASNDSAPRDSSREGQLSDALRQNAGMFAALAAKHNVLFQGFDATSFDLRVEKGSRGAADGIDLGKPLGPRTMIGQSLEQTLRRVAARPVAGIVLLSDGRSGDIPGRNLFRQLEARHIPVFTVPLGSDKEVPDLAITHVESPGAAFVGDLVPVTVDVELLGADQNTGAGGELSGAVQLVDATGKVLDERPLDSAPSGASPQTGPKRRITLLSKPGDAGAATWTVRLVTSQPDLTADNNSAAVRVEVADRPIRVLYFDGYPRWEYRYLKNILVREKSIKSSALLLASERRYIQDGNEVLDSIPRTPKAWQPFDVIVMGDLRPELFSDEQLAQIKELIAERGAGLLWIGGAGSTPGAWRGTPLADLLPFALAGKGDGASRSDGGAGGLEPYLSPILIKPGAAAERYGVLQLSENPQDPWPRELLDSDLGWPLMRWAQRITPAMLKPTTEVLATATPVALGGGPATSADSGNPLVMSMRYGAGRVVYVATDETWRYRYCRGEVLTERFWIPLIRLLARESLGRGDQVAVLAASPKQVQVGQQVQITARLLDQTLIEKRAAKIEVKVSPVAKAGSPAGRPIDVTLLPEKHEDEIGETGAAVFSASWAAAEPGAFSIEPADPLLAGFDIKARVEVAAPDDEMRFPQTDHATLAMISKASGGVVLTPARLAELPTLLPNRELRILGTPDVETLWDKPVMWIALMVLLAAEWIGRRLIKLA